MLIHQLNMLIPLQKQGKVVKPGDDALQFHPIDQKYRHGNMVLAHGVEENFLQVMVFIVRNDLVPLIGFLS